MKLLTRFRLELGQGPLLGLAAAVFLAAASSGSAQLKQPVAGQFVLKHAFTDVQAKTLSRAIEQRPATTASALDPKVIHDIAITQAPPVEVTDSKVVAAQPPLVTVNQPPVPFPAKVEVVRTTLADEALLQRALAGNDALKPALASAGSSLITLPGVVKMTEAEGAPLQLKPFILVSQPLQREKASGQYSGELLIGVSEIADTGEIRHLPTPLLFEIAGAARSVPDRVLLDSTSPPFRRVRIWLNAAEGAAARLLVLSLLDKGGTPIAVPVAGELRLDTASASIEGWGLETTKVEISLNHMGEVAGRPVTLHVGPSGYLDKGIVRLEQDGSGEAELRSDGIGTAHIRATSAGLAPASADIVYRFPIRTLGASMAGGLLGALVSLLAAPQRRKRPWIRLVGSTLFGILVFALYVVGINILPFQPKVTVGAALVFAISALAAWLGPAVSSWRRRLPGPG